MYKKIIATILSVFALVSGYYTFDTYVAKAKDIAEVREFIETVSMRLDAKILEDDRRAIQGRIWQLEDRHGSYDRMTPSVKEEYRRLKDKLRNLDNKLKKYGR